MSMFRDLRADEIECRVAQAKENGVSLLLYKDARCDQNILDETVGPMNWQRSHLRENANCVVSIWDDKKQWWVSKEDTGTESTTEKEKGLASDSFKRACFNWGVGRELYTAPFIWVKADGCAALKQKQNGTDPNRSAQVSHTGAYGAQKLCHRSSHYGDHIACRKFCTAHRDRISCRAERSLRGKHGREEHHEKC